MKPQGLCEHLRPDAGARPFEIAHAWLFQDGPIDAIARCRTCGAQVLLRLVDWAPPVGRVRVYAAAAVDPDAVSLYLRDVARGSCDVRRAGAELDALWASAAPSELLAYDVGGERVLARGAAPADRRISGLDWPARLPPRGDAAWFEALGLAKEAP